MDTNVLVVGAGPAMAAELARYGVSVRIVEKAAQRTDKSQAIVMWSRSLEMLDRMGCTAPFLSAGLKVTGANIAAGVKQIAHIKVDRVASPHPYALMIPQCDTERLLEEHLNTFAVKVERTVELGKRCYAGSAKLQVRLLRPASSRPGSANSSRFRASQALNDSYKKPGWG
jgi:2-polyprenyl-6-methoxyphenol hydroxylase-like FAD-dependent oxidoreductase